MNRELEALMVTSETFNGVKSEKKSEYDNHPVWPMHPLDKLCLEQGYALDVAYVFDNNTRIDKEALQRSLSLILKSYPTFSARVDPLNQNQIVLNDQGALFIVAEESETLASEVITNESDLKRGRFIDYSKSTRQLVKGNEPLLRVKFTSIKDGCVLGVWASHGICDGATFYGFMSNWSKVCDQVVSGIKDIVLPEICNNQHIIPYHNTSRRSREAVEKDMQRLNWGSINIPEAAVGLGEIFLRDGILLHHDERTKPFRFTQETLKRMKAFTEEDARRDNVTFLTTNEVLSSFMCQMMSSLFEFEVGTQMNHSTILNWRSRFMNLPENFAGNASCPIKTSNFVVGESLGSIAAKMHNELLKYKSNTPELRETVLLNLDMHYHGIFGHACDPKTLPYLARIPTTVITNNFALYPIYQVPFGTGKQPTKVIPHHCGDQVIIWPTPDNQGVDVYFQGSTSRIIKSLPESSPWFTELFKFSNPDVLNKGAVIYRTVESLPLMRPESSSNAQKEIEKMLPLSPVHVTQFKSGAKRKLMSALAQTMAVSMCFVTLFSTIALSSSS